MSICEFSKYLIYLGLEDKIDSLIYRILFEWRWNEKYYDWRRDLYGKWHLSRFDWRVWAKFQVIKMRKKTYIVFIRTSAPIILLHTFIVPYTTHKNAIVYGSTHLIEWCFADSWCIVYSLKRRKLPGNLVFVEHDRIIFTGFRELCKNNGHFILLNEFFIHWTRVSYFMMSIAKDFLVSDRTGAVLFIERKKPFILWVIMCSV